jgi:hypothetical protein
MKLYLLYLKYHLNIRVVLMVVTGVAWVDWGCEEESGVDLEVAMAPVVSGMVEALLEEKE